MQGNQHIVVHSPVRINRLFAEHDTLNHRADGLHNPAASRYAAHLRCIPCEAMRRAAL